MMAESEKKYLTRSERGTMAVAKRLAGRIPGGSVVGLTGPLGAGKTVFVKGLALALGVKTVVNSPTFVVMNVYDVGRRQVRYLVHVDCYRLSDPGEAAEIGLTDYLGRPDSIVVVEWAEKIVALLPRTAIGVDLQPKKNGHREIRVGVKL